jgi:O-antigen/teichoic acid export membrane protein
MESIRFLYVVLSAVSAFGIVLAPWFISALYGEKWQEAILPFQILVIAGFFYGFEVSEMVYYAVGKPQLRVWIIGIRLSLFLAFAAAFGVSKGIVGIATSLTLSVALAAFISVFLVARVTDTRWIKFLQPIWPSLLSAIIASILVLILMFLLQTVMANVSPWIFLIGSGVVLAFLYTVLIMIIFPSLFSQLRTGMRQVFQR